MYTETEIQGSGPEDELDIIKASLHIADMARVTAIRALESKDEQIERVLHESQIDKLTNMYNQVTWRDLLDNVVAESKRTGEQVAVAFTDLNAFKKVNDTIGHDKGDELLRAYTGDLIEFLRGGDSIPGRLGGDEFGIFGKLALREGREPLSNEEMYEGFKNRIRKFNETFVGTNPIAIDVRQTVPDFGISTGFASTIDGYEDGEKLYKAADQSMFEVKRESGTAR